MATKEQAKARRKALQDAGLTRVDVWVTKENKAAVVALDGRKDISTSKSGDKDES